MKTKTLILALVLSLSLVVVGLALANGGIELPRWVLSSGVSESSGGGVTLQASIGQPMVGVVSSGDVSLGQGFWYGGSLAKDGYEIILPLVMK